MVGRVEAPAPVQVHHARELGMVGVGVLDAGRDAGGEEAQQVAQVLGAIRGRVGKARVAQLRARLPRGSRTARATGCRPRLAPRDPRSARPCSPRDGRVDRPSIARARSDEEVRVNRFIVGTGRCGSTLLSTMIAKNPAVLSLFEFFNGLDGTRRFRPRADERQRVPRPDLRGASLPAHGARARLRRARGDVSASAHPACALHAEERRAVGARRDAAAARGRRPTRSTTSCAPGSSARPRGRLPRTRARSSRG